MLRTTLGGCQLSLESCIYNASGPLSTTSEELIQLARSDAGAILTKSCTKYFREGNIGKRYYNDQAHTYSINSTGLANLGYNFYASFASKIKTIVSEKLKSKPYIISVAGLTLDDNLQIINHLYTLSTTLPDAIELNLSCPNIDGKPQVSYDLDATELYLRKIFDPNSDLINNQYVNIPIGLKLSPYFDHQQFVNVANIIKEYPISFVTCINSLGHGLFIDWETEQTVIHPNQGHGGIGGKIIHPIAIANVRKFRQLLPDKIDVIGCGGVKTGKDVFNHILAGASAVQVGTQYMIEGPAVFQRLNQELMDIMIQKNYQTIHDFHNQLQILPP